MKINNLAEDRWAGGAQSNELPSILAHFSSYIERLTERGGPSPCDYEELTDQITLLHAAVESNDVSMDEIHDLMTRFRLLFSKDTMQGFALHKPHGYAGDYEIIDRIYLEHIVANPDFANWDRYFHAHPASKAVRNRKSYFHELLDALSHIEARVLKVGIGPGRSMYEWLTRNVESRLTFECIDIDQDAISYAENLNRLHADRITYHHQNALKFQSAHRYELIWSAGLFDYFNNRVFVHLGRRLFKHLAPGGELVIGNFAQNNPSRPYMELVGDWHLHHRARQELLNLGQEISEQACELTVKNEPENVNLFLHIRKT